MNIFLQIWGGAFYLGNKIFLSLSEGQGANSRHRVWGWACYLLGLPAWIVILAFGRNWIAAALELGSAPAMLLGLVTALRGEENTHGSLLAKIAVSLAYILIPFGVGYSLYDYGGLVSITQFLEIAAMIGFLGGTYLLAKNRRTGWLLFMLMNGSVAVLMLLQDNLILSLQQLISLGFVFFGYWRSGR